MDYPFGFEGFEDDRGDTVHPTHGEMQSYAVRTLRSFAEIGQDDFLRFEQHFSRCDACLLALIKTRINYIKILKH